MSLTVPKCPQNVRHFRKQCFYVYFMPLDNSYCLALFELFLLEKSWLHVSAQCPCLQSQTFGRPAVTIVCAMVHALLNAQCALSKA